MIGIDEAQFFEDLYDFCLKAADQDGKTVIVAGLDGDYLRYCLKHYNFMSVSLGSFPVLSHCFFMQEELRISARCNTSC